MSGTKRGQEMNEASQVSKQRRVREAGITLIEMLVVITIIALFSAIAYQRLTPALDEGRKTAAKTQIGSLAAATQLFNIENGRFPTQEEGIDSLRPFLQKDIPPTLESPLHLSLSRPARPRARHHLLRR